MTKKLIKPSDVSKYPELRELAQSLCDQDNHVDGILILHPTNSENQIFMSVFSENKFQGVDIEALGGNLTKVLSSSKDLIFSTSGFEPGNTKTITYEFDELVFFACNVIGETLDNVYLILVNVSDKDLGSFNANRRLVRAKMEVAIKRCGLLGAAT